MAFPLYCKSFQFTCRGQHLSEFKHLQKKDLANAETSWPAFYREPIEIKILIKVDIILSKSFESCFVKFPVVIQ